MEDSFPWLDGLYSLAKRDEGRLSILEETLAHKKQLLTDLIAKIESTTEVQKLDLGATEIVKALFDKLSEVGVKFLENLVTQAFSVVFDDEDYQFKIGFGDRAGERTVMFRVKSSGGEFNLADCGGGVQVLVAFVFRVYFILVYDLRRIIVMDEMFSQLSPQYLDSLVAFLKLLVREFSFNFLWISHSPALEGKVDRFYEISNGVLTER